jgi:antirestriction protein ArdC
LPSEGRIQLPPQEQIRSSEGYYATAMHKLTHWCGHKSHLNRDLKGCFGTAAYTAEELVAEIGAAFLCDKAGVTAEPREDNAQNLKSWIGVIGVVTIAGDDHGALVRLASTGALVKVTGA